MGYDDDSSVTIPPEPTAAGRRRRTDHINWRKVAYAVIGSMPLWGSIAWKAGEIAFAAHAQWLEFQRMPPRIQDLEETAKEHAELVKRLESLERYRCVLGYDPGGVFGKASILARNDRAQCRTMPVDLALPAPAVR